SPLTNYTTIINICPIKMVHSNQLTFPAPRTWGGRRAGAGRKLQGPRPSVSHHARPVHVGRHPVHVTLRRRRDLPSLRVNRTFLAVRGAIAASSAQSFRVLHFSVQSDHVHLIAEAGDHAALSRGVQGMAIRIAKAVNRRFGTKGAVWGDR